MFRKIVSNLPFSNALIGQLSFYAKRLKKEEVTRRLGLVFIALTLVVQCLVVFQPSESANASSETDMVSGGIGNSINNFLTPYDSNTKHLKDIMNYAGITRSEITAANYTSWRTDSTISWGLASRFSYAQGERQHSILDSKGNKVTTVYSRPLSLWTSKDTTIHGWVGYSKKMGWFGIMRQCGNLVTKKLPAPTPPPKCVLNSNILASDKNCKPCPGNETILVSDVSCKPNIIKTKTATNTSQGFTDATSSEAKPGDQISYTVTIQNTGSLSTDDQFVEHLGNVLEYSTLVDNGGGTLDASTKVLSWQSSVFKLGEKQTRTFVVQVMDPIPATAQGTSDPTSFDCTLSNTFGNSINIKVECPTLKVIETVASELPTTGPTENLLFAGVVFALATYFYARSRQMKKEVFLIKKDATIGAI